MARSDDGMQQLARALEVLRQHRQEPKVSDATFLAGHAELRELLEPLLASETDEDARPVLGDYRLVREIGRGGMGIVHEAVQISLGRRVALKVLPDHRGASPTALARFHREAELTARLHHDHLVPIFAVGHAAGVHYFAMELVTGCSLADLLKRLDGQDAALLHGTSMAQALGEQLGDPAAGASLRARSHFEAVLATVLPLAEALAYAHGHGIVHRDVKPGNVLLRPDGTPLLTDFGLARDLAAPGLTRTGDMAGTPHYMAPEQIEKGAGEIDGRADVFALAVTLYELLTLRRPFDASTAEGVIVRVLRAVPRSPQRFGLRLPPDLLAVLDKAMQKWPTERYASMAAFAEDLRAVLEFRPVSVSQPGMLSRIRRYARREPLRATLVAVLALGVPSLLGLGGYLLSQRPRIAAAAERELRLQAEALWEAGYLEVGEGNPFVAVRRFRAADAILADQPETIVGLVLALEQCGQPDQASTERQRLAGGHEALRQELLGLSCDVDAAEAKGSAFRPPEPPADPKDALGCYVRGMRWLAYAHDCVDREAFATAARWLREAIDRALVARALYHCQYLHVVFHLQEHDQLRSFVRVVEDLWPESPIVRYWLGFVLADLDPDRASLLLRQVITARPDLALPHISLAQIDEQRLHWAEAVQRYEKVLAHIPDERLALIGMARALVHCDRSEEALSFADRAVRVMPRSHSAWTARAAALLDLGRAADAVPDAQRAVQLGEGNPEANIVLSRVQLVLGDPVAARVAGERAIRLAPRDSEAHVVLARALAALGQPGEAARCYEEVVKLRPTWANAWSDLALQRQASGDADGADAAFAKAREYGADVAIVQYTLGSWRKQRGDREGAERHYLRAIELDPKNARARVNLGALAWTTDHEAATKWYREAVAVAPGLEAASDGLAWVLGEQGKHDEACAERTRWAEANPENPIAWFKLAMNRLHQSDWSAALLAIARAEAAAGEPRADVLYWRGEVFLRRGDDATAWRPLFEQARGMANCSPELRQRIAERLR